LRILDILDRMMNSGQGDAVEEAVPESLKNILLVMGGAGYLSPPSENPENEKMWTETKKRLDRFLPDLFSEVFPEKKAENEMEEEKEKEATVGQTDGSAAERPGVEAK
jgi:brefeldin A-resistance guanine nucleotide exchange factor 1